MTDRELLELAAKAAGIEIATWSNCQAGGFQSQASAQGKFWNPLTDDSYALRLAVKLKISIYTDDDTYVFAVEKERRQAETANPETHLGWCETLNNDAQAATRRAIVRAAAAIQQSKEQTT